MNIGLWLARQAEAAPERPALFLGAQEVASYGAFHDQSLCLAGWMQAQGIAPGDRVAIFMKNRPDYLICLFAIWYAGAVAVPINAKLHGREAAWIMDNAGASLCFASAGLAADLAAVDCPVEVLACDSHAFETALGHHPLRKPLARASEDLAWLFYTSGTTGRPKGVMITHRMLMLVSLAYGAEVDQVSSEDCTLYAAPMSHGAGLYSMLHVQAGARHVCPPSEGFDEAEIFDLAAFHGRVHMFAAPTMVKRMTEVAKAEGLSGQGLRSVIYAGGPMYLADIIEAVAHFGPVFIQIYGQGEAPMGITALTRQDVADRTDPRWRQRLASVGRAQAPVELRIGDAKGQPLPVGTPGEIMLRSDIVMPGYWQNPDATAETIRDGWLCTGDVGFLDEEGYLTLQDRSKDLIISGGTNIYPREVEEALLLHPDVAEASVVGRPHPEWGEDVVAFVVMVPGRVLDPQILDAHCLDQIARFKRPKDYFALQSLPKNNYGKVLKTELRARLAAGEGQGS